MSITKLCTLETNKKKNLLCCTSAHLLHAQKKNLTSWTVSYIVPTTRIDLDSSNAQVLPKSLSHLNACCHWSTEPCLELGVLRWQLSHLSPVKGDHITKFLSQLVCLPIRYVFTDHISLWGNINTASACLTYRFFFSFLKHINQTELTSLYYKVQKLHIWPVSPTKLCLGDKRRLGEEGLA